MTARRRSDEHNGEQIARLAREDGWRAAQFVAEYRQQHNEGPPWWLVGKQFAWPPKLTYPIVWRLINHGKLRHTEGERGSLRPGPDYVAESEANQ
jgi:hypothetical protein